MKIGLLLRSKKVPLTHHIPGESSIKAKQEDRRSCMFGVILVITCEKSLPTIVIVTCNMNNYNHQNTHTQNQ